MSGAERDMSGDLRDGSSGGVPYAFHHQVPEEFVRIPEPTESDGWRAAMAKLMPDCTEEELDAAGQGLRDNLPDLHDSENVTLTAMCIGTEEVDGDERLSMGLLAVTVRPSDHVAAQRLPTAEGIYRTTEKKFFSGENPDDLEPLDFPLGKGVKGKQDMLLAAKLPCGPAVMSTSLRTLHVPPLAEGMGRTPLAMASLQLIVPAPDSYCVYVTISTPSVFLLDSYSARLAHIGRTLVFQDPAGPTPAM